MIYRWVKTVRETDFSLTGVYTDIVWKAEFKEYSHSSQWSIVVVWKVPWTNYS